MTEGPIYITREGCENLRREYEELVSSKRQELAEKIKEAREQGDLSENAAYKSAKDEQGFVETRIAELEGILKVAEVVEPSSGCCEVAIGCRVKLALETGGDSEFQVVGSLEADPERGKISYQSPLGQALLGRRVGEAVEVETAVGKLVYKVEGIL